VNDLGGGIKGDDGAPTSRPAQQVVDEIKQAGGEAVANFDSVEFGEKIIATAVEAYGKVDIVINNAGILRDRSFSKTEPLDWDLIFKVHATGSYSVTHAAWELMRKQGFGRVIMTTSAAGLYGNHGQANYSAAKLAILGLANTLAIEGERRGIFVNTIAPVAGTRMTATVMPPNLVEALKTEYVAPLVLYLCHESSTVNGGIFEIGAGWVSSVRWERTQGKLFSPQNFSPETIAESWNQITDFSTNPQYPKSASDSITYVLGALEQAKASEKKKIGNDDVQPDVLLAHNFEPITVSYSARDVAFYALSVGAASNPLDSSELSFVYENHENFQALPTFGITFPFALMGQLIGAPGLKFNPMLLLHGEQNLRIVNPIPVEGKMTSTGKVIGLYDKGKSTTVVLEVTSKDETGKEIVVNEFTVFIRGIGNFGGDRGPAPENLSPPSTPPTKVHTEKTNENQAAIYRWASGDLNPLHIDSTMAAMGNFDRPILHGMCTYGYAARAVLKHFCNNDTTRFKGIKARMTKHVFPGETLETSMWQVSPSKIIFQVKTVERGEVVLANAAVEIVPDQNTNAGSSALAGVKPGFQSTVIFEQILAHMPTEGPEQVKKVGGLYHFKITGGPNGESQSWTIDLKNPPGAIRPEAPENADCTIIVSDADCINLFGGKLTPVRFIFLHLFGLLF
jgi:NAD(P)-dependent dehydrogenase (short-subunit alcohol dehydrogenase family)/acyl dehydratase